MPSASRPKSRALERGKASPPKRAAMPADAAGPSAIMRVARELASWANSVLGVAEGATEMTVAAGKSLVRSSGQKAAIAKAGEFLRAAREAAEITVDELGQAVNLSDPKLIEDAEEGKAALPFDLILRLAAVLGRNDPISFALKLTRTYNPGIWKALDGLGAGKLVVQAGRERDFANLYRANDAARRLTDEDFAHVLKFVGAAFDMAVGFHASRKARRAERSDMDGDG
ncbi:MAG TPA: helix-turn-helix transcriptional regulator [Roseiarcus sp.]|nr:helix-turn-helix transcriptional regulator [Roseiarcus sp.]